MEAKDRATFLDSITKSSLSQEFEHLAVGDPRAEKVEELLIARGTAESLSGLLRLLGNPDFDKWLKAREMSDNAVLVKIIRAEGYDPFKFGKLCGRMDLILQLRSSKLTLEAELFKARAKIHEIEDLLK